MESVPLEAFRNITKEAKSDTKRENAGGGWIWGKGTEPYEINFEGLLGLSVSLDNLLRERKSAGKPAFVLDMMAPLDSFLTGLDNIDGGVAVTLTDQRGVLARTFDNFQEKLGLKRKLILVTGDIFLRETWSKLDQSMRKLEIKDRGFDLIVARPMAGLSVREKHMPANLSLLRRAWTRLSSDGGRMFFDIGHPQWAPVASEWIKLLKEKYHMRCEFDAQREAVMLVKDENSPSELPFSKQRG